MDWHDDCDVGGRVEEFLMGAIVALYVLETILFQKTYHFLGGHRHVEDHLKGIILRIIT